VPELIDDDTADVVVAAPRDERHANKLYEVTGPRALTFAEAAAEIAAATGRAIRYAQISAQDFAAGMRQAGVPDDVVALLYELFTVVLDGRSSKVMQGVEEALGRPARDFADAQAAAATDVGLKPCASFSHPACSGSPRSAAASSQESTSPSRPSS
jgi:hypothetical protein